MIDPMPDWLAAKLKRFGAALHAERLERETGRRVELIENGRRVGREEWQRWLRVESEPPPPAPFRPKP